MEVVSFKTASPIHVEFSHFILLADDLVLNYLQLLVEMIFRAFHCSDDAKGLVRL